MEANITGRPIGAHLQIARPQVHERTRLETGVWIDNQALNNPGGWQDWATQSRIVRGLTEGEKTMRLDFIDGPINTNWIQFTRLAPE